jgi:hypothetical protein
VDFTLPINVRVRCPLNTPKSEHLDSQDLEYKDGFDPTFDKNNFIKSTDSLSLWLNSKDLNPADDDKESKLIEA